MRLQLALLLLVVNTVAGQQCDLEKLDLLTAKILGFNRHHRKFPTSNGQISTYCRATRADLNEAMAINEKCAKGSTAKQMTSIFLFSVRNVVKGYCSKRNQKQLARRLRMSRCVNTHSSLIDRCMQKYQQKTIDASSLVEKYRIPAMCCEYHVLLNCLSESLNSKCAEDVPELIDLFDSVIGNILNFACGEYGDDSDQCSRLPKSTKVKAAKKWNTVLVPLLEMWNSTQLR